MASLPVWSIWMTFGVLLTIAEIFTATFFLLCFGVAALLAAAAGLIGLGAATQWVVFISASAVAVIFSQAFASKYSGKPVRRAGVDRFLGERALVIERVDPAEGTGRVRVLHEEWRVDAEAGRTFEVSDRVLVTGVRGTHLVVTENTGD